MLLFVTTNEGKLREAKEYLPTDVEQFDYDYAEIQSNDLTEIAETGAREAYREVQEPVFVEDSGLFVNSLSGFPGPYSSYVYETLGIERVADLALGESDQSARFQSVIAYCDEDGVEQFKGTVPGEIVAPRGDGGFGYDPIFEHDGRTFAEITTAEKNAISHRGRALATFADWLAGADTTTHGTR